MTYVKQTWANDAAGTTPVSAARLNYMELGIENAAATIVSLQSFYDGDWDDALESAIVATATDGGTIRLPVGEMEISDEHVIPQKVALWGEGGAEDFSASRFKCMTANAGIRFGTISTGGYGGVSGNFLVDGNNVATDPLKIGMTVGRVFIGLHVIYSAGTGMLVEACQNSIFINTTILHSAGVDCILDNSANGNLFSHYEFGGGDLGHILIRNSGAGPFAAPEINIFSGPGHIEFGPNTIPYAIKQTAGSYNIIQDAIFAYDGVTTTFPMVKLDGGSLIIDGGVLAFNGSAGTAFEVNGGGELILRNRPTIIGATNVFNINAGTVEDLSGLRIIGTPVYSVGAVEAFAAVSNNRRSPVNLVMEDTTDVASRVTLVAELATGNRFHQNGDGSMSWGPGSSFTGDTTLYRHSSGLHTNKKLTAELGLGAPSVAATGPVGTVVRKMQVFDEWGTAIGFIPVYDAIT